VTTAAVRLVSRFGFDDAGFRRLGILVAVGNGASRAVAEKVGTVQEGVLRCRIRVRERAQDAVLYGLLPEDLDGTEGPKGGTR